MGIGILRGIGDRQRSRKITDNTASCHLIVSHCPIASCHPIAWGLLNHECDRRSCQLLRLTVLWFVFYFLRNRTVNESKLF